MEAIIEARHLKKAYGEGEALQYALNDVSLSIYEHEFLVIIGGSGSGKSTLLNMLGGMDEVDEGEIIFAGEDIAKFNRKKMTLYRRNDIGYVYQFFNLLNDINVLQNVTLAPGADKRIDKALELLEKVGLKGKEKKFPRQLSGGQQQRVAIARALNKDSRLLLCDEPTGALDDASGKAVLELLSDIYNTTDKTIVLVTHTKEIAAIAGRVITMRDGKIVEERINEHPISPSEVQW